MRLPAPSNASLPLLPPPEHIAHFWDWVRDHLTGLTPPPGMSTDPSQMDPTFLETYQEAGARLQQLAAHLVLELRAPGTEPSTGGLLVVSCNGRREGIPAVLAVCEGAPSLPGWSVVAFRQPAPDRGSWEVAIGGRRMSADTVRVVPGDTTEGRLDIALYLPGYRRTPDLDFEQAGMLMLDHTLGEYAVMTRIGAIEFRAPTLKLRKAVTLRDLPSVLDRLAPAILM